MRGLPRHLLRRQSERPADGPDEERHVEDGVNLRLQVANYVEQAPRKHARLLLIAPREGFCGRRHPEADLRVVLQIAPRLRMALLREVEVPVDHGHEAGHQRRHPGEFRGDVLPPGLIALAPQEGQI